MKTIHDVTSNDLLSLIGCAMIVPMLVTASLMAFFVVSEIGLGIVLGILSFMMLTGLTSFHNEIRTKLGLE